MTYWHFTKNICITTQFKLFPIHPFLFDTYNDKIRKRVHSRLEVFTLVSEIFDNVHMVLGIKNLFELEGVIDTRESSFRFLSRINSYISTRTSNCKAGGKEVDTNRIPFYRRNIRYGYC